MLRKSKGNMYEWVTHTWNPIKGACYHDCSYCYMKRWGRLNPVHLDEKELKTDLGVINFIFLGSSCDMWANDIPEEWIKKVLKHCSSYPHNRYLFQTKNPYRFLDFIDHIPDNTVLCITIESNRVYPQMGYAPSPYNRLLAIMELKKFISIYITIEPIMDFDLNILVAWMEVVEPNQINIGADSGGNNLPEPKVWKIKKLRTKLNKVTKVHIKKNLKRLLT